MKQTAFASLSFDAKKKRTRRKVFLGTWIGGAVGSAGSVDRAALPGLQPTGRPLMALPTMGGSIGGLDQSIPGVLLWIDLNYGCEKPRGRHPL